MLALFSKLAFKNSITCIGHVLVSPFSKIMSIHPYSQKSKMPFLTDCFDGAWEASDRNVANLTFDLN